MRGDLLAEGDGFGLAGVHCDGGYGGFSGPEETGRHGLVFVCRGAFVRRIPDRVAAGRPRPAAHHGLARRTRELLLADPGLGVIELSRRLHCSPHHLSRVFGQVTGSSVSAYRTRIRVGHALDRIADGETNLAVLASDLGFADHAHLTRTIRAVTGRTPSALRAALRGLGGSH